MTTMRQFQRGVTRTVRFMEREAQRREKLNRLREASYAAESYATLMRALTEAHHVVMRRRDWSSARAQAELDPQPDTLHERFAIASRDGYQPSPLARWLGLADKRRAKLEQAIINARTQDARDHECAVAGVRARNLERAKMAAVIALEPMAVMEVIEELSTADRFPLALKGLSLQFGGECLAAHADGIDIDDLPTQSITLLQSGKASVKALSKARIFELHRDTSCSLAARMAVELLGEFPIETIEIVVHSKILDRGTGNMLRQPTVVLRTTAQALASVNLARAEASFLIEHLGGRFSFNKREGLSRIKGDL